MATTSHTSSHVPSGTERMLPSIADVDITEVYCPAQGNAVVADIVFVHGLMGHPKNTWLFGKEPKAQPSVVSGESAQKKPFWKKLSGRDKAGDKSYDKPVKDTQYCFWPYDLLPKDDVISNARILLYGYDSHPTHFYKTGTNRMTITQHAENLMHNVAGVRVQCRGRPLIFIAHSLGGILVKGALNESRQMSQPQYSDLYSSCQAIIFMGTPHAGADIAVWGTWTSNIVGALPGGIATYSKVLQGLEPDSETLYAITRRFNETLNQPIPSTEKIQVCSVQEGKGMLSVKGAGSKVVPDSSSKFNRTDIEQSFFNQTANHMTMCKFSSAEDQTYRNVLRVLQGYFRVIEEKRADLQRAVDTNTQAKVSDFVKALNFDGRLARERQLNTLITDEHSFDWVWGSDFVEWLKCDAKVFWVAGKPASGKSTLVNYVTSHNRTREVAEVALGGGLVVAKFFFDFRAKGGLSNNLEGLRRSLLHQLLKVSSALAADIMQHFNVDRLDDHIMLADATIFEYALHRNDRPTLLFVDGLDEYEGNKPELLSLIDKITKYKVKICLSSRYEKPFSTTFKDLRFQFRMESLNKTGIRAYAKHILETTLRPSNYEERLILDSASEDIAQCSSGVFLWARFAVSDVVDRVCEGQQVKYGYIRTIIHSMPPELEDIYARIFQLMKDKDKKPCGIILALIDSAEQILELSELFEATLIAGNDFRSLDDDVISEDLKYFQLYLMAVGAGLIHCFVPDVTEAYAVRRVIHVTMIHKSVRTYLYSRGWNQLFGEQRALEPKQSHHELWLNICHDFLAGKRVRWDVPFRTHDDTRDSSLQPRGQRHLIDCESLLCGLYNYVHALLPYHAYRYEQETAKSSRPLIQKVLSSQFVREHIRVTLDRESAHHCEDRCGLMIKSLSHNTVLCDDVQLAVSHHLDLYVEEALQRHPEAFRSDTFVSAIVTADSVFAALEEESRPLEARFRRAGPLESRITSPLDGPRASPLATAVLWRCQGFGHKSPKLVLLLAPHSSRLEDVDMLMAIRTLSTPEIEALLTHFPPSPLYLSSKLSDHAPHAIESWMKDPDSMAVNVLYGPLWEVARREDTDSIAELLRLFLDRGETINSRCGPKGTIFHSVAEDKLLHIKWSRPTGSLVFLFGIFISHGANINTKGQEGNVLEHVWKDAHMKHMEAGLHFVYGIRPFSPLVESLIKMGATNSVRDPNGLIPSKARMLEVAKRYVRPSKQDVDYYFHGTCSDTQAVTHLRQLDGLASKSSERLNCPTP